MKHLNTRTQFGFSILPFALCIFLILLCACDGGSGTSDESPSDTGSIAFSLVLEDSSISERSVVRASASVSAGTIDCAASGISTVEATVYDQNDNQLKAGGPWPCDNHQGTITGVQRGDNRKVVILCKNSAGNVLYRGEKPGITVTGGETTDVGGITVSPETYTLTVVKDSTGSGIVMSPSVGIDCGTDCTETYDAGTEVTLTATQGEGSAFAGWSGGGCNGTGQCVITINADTSITATFTLNTYTVSVTAGTGGTIDPPNSVMVNHGANQTFTITPDDGYHVGNVIVDGSSVGAVTTYSFTNVTADHTIEAAFNSWMVWHVDGSVEKSGDGTSWIEAFKTIKEGMDIAVYRGGMYGDIVVVKSGTYTGPGNKNLNFSGKAITVRSEDGPEATIIDCENEGMGFIFNNIETSSSVVDGFTIRNENFLGGGGIYCLYSCPNISNCIITNGSGPGIYCENASPLITNCTITENITNRGAGIYCLGDSNPTITKCIITGNSATDWCGGGILFDGTTNNPSATISNCIIAENYSNESGGGIHCRLASPKITNCIIKANIAKTGGGISCDWISDSIITNCTISENESTFGGGFYCFGSSPFITNCILWNNNASDSGAEIYNNINTSILTISHSDLQGGIQSIFNTNGATATDGGGNINVDPIFVDPTNDNFRLQQGSPCIDSGDNDAVPADIADLDGDTEESVPFDLDGNPRFVDDPDTIDTGNGMPPIVDMGAYEYLVP